MNPFMNVSYPRNFYLDEDPDTLIQYLVPPPPPPPPPTELHILIAMVTTLCLLMNLWPEFDNFLKTRGVTTERISRQRLGWEQFKPDT